MLSTPIWILITLQIAMGAFDTLYHHELTERLAWRPSQRHELQLHGVRNLFYCLLFIGLGCLQLTGLLAWAVGALLIVELCITLKDFVEEDMTRKLPASERVTHTLLALNYGAIIALLMPVLAAWAALPTGITFAPQGLWAVLMVFAGIGVAVFGVRDLAAAKRLTRMAAAKTPPLLPVADKRLRILITGATGFIGSRMVAALSERGHDVTVLTRNVEKAAKLGAPLTVITDLGQIADDARFDSIINLAGQPVAGWLWTAKYKAAIMQSRLDMTRGLVALMARLNHKPDSFISGSAIGIYGAKAHEPVDETTRIKGESVFSQTMCLEWEAEANKARDLGVRTVNLRTGLVLDTAGGSLGQMLFAFEFGLGGPFGNGQHIMSWITRSDLVRLIFHCIDKSGVSGPVNATAPNPVSNRAFAKALGRALHRPAVIAIAERALTFALGDLGREIFLGSQNVRPNAALGSGFVFAAPDIKTAFADMFNLAPRGGRPDLRLKPVSAE